jgi:hypothetical protein
LNGANGAIEPQIVGAWLGEMEMADAHRKGEPVYDIIPKSQFGRGPWLDEPDRCEWISQDLLCIVLRHPRGYLQGFVGVPWGRALWGLPAEDVSRRKISVHRGITFAGEPQVVELISSSPYAGEIRARSLRDDFERTTDTGLLWFVGFHCAHDWTTDRAGDFAPDDSLAGEHPTASRVYRSFVYAGEQVDRLAMQVRNEISRRLSQRETGWNTNGDSGR